MNYNYSNRRLRGMTATTNLRINETLLGAVADNLVLTYAQIYTRYEDVCKKHGDTSLLAWPEFVDKLRVLPYGEQAISFKVGD